LNKALSLGFDYLATGHYLRVKRYRSKTEGKKKKLFRVFKAEDDRKDQSYFLYNLTQRQLRHLLFPVGNFTKSGVRKLAKKFGLPTAGRRESQGICFILEKEHNKFLKRYLKNIESGPVMTVKGEEVGMHSGLPFYTLGQRRGIRIGGLKPYYVVGLDYQRNILVVTDDPQDEWLYSKSLVFSEVNWIGGREPNFPFKTKAAVRYRHKPIRATIREKKRNEYYLNFVVRQKAVMPGQSVVFYRGKELIGGGVIKRKNK
jgi:tRNA-specific 2-thiouridylase